MKALYVCLVLLFPVALFASPPSSRVSEVSSIGIMPGFKKGLQVQPGERNPYGVVAVPKQEVVATGVEGARLTAILESLPVSGLTRGQDGKVRALLLGDLRLEQGAIVPQLLEGQTDELVVKSLTDEEVVIAWRLEAGRLVTTPRVLRRKIDLSPKVEIYLPGQSGGGATDAAARKKSAVMVRERSRVPPAIVPTSGLPPVKP